MAQKVGPLFRRSNFLFELGASFGMSLEGDCHELEVTLNFELLVTLGISLEGVCHGKIQNFNSNSKPILRDL
jgi:hypothetical protein